MPGWKGLTRSHLGVGDGNSGHGIEERRGRRRLSCGPGYSTPSATISRKLTAVNFSCLICADSAGLESIRTDWMPKPTPKPRAGGAR